MTEQSNGLAAKLNKAPVEDTGVGSGTAAAEGVVKNNVTDVDTIPRVDVAEEAGKAGQYKATGLSRFFRSKGDKVEPINGFYTPESAEDEQQLEYYASKGLCSKV